LFSRKKEFHLLTNKTFKFMKKKLSAKDCGVKSALWDKFLCIMRKSLILSIFFCNIVAFAYSQKVSITAKNESLSTVLKSITKKTKVEFFYSDDVFDAARKVNISVNNTDIMIVLKQIIGENFKAEFINNKLIAIAVNEKPKAVKSVFIGEKVKVQGIILNNKKEPLPGVSVYIKSTNESVITNFDGSYEIMVKKGDILVFEYLGYKKIEVTISDILIINPILIEDVNSLDEIIISNGYQKVPKERLTGSFEVLDSKTINRSSSSNILDRLNGLVSGVVFNTRNTNVANPLPKGQPEFTIRGLSSINANKNPLIIVDNFPYKDDINNLNPNDVESITVLKDAGAASIWGAQAGNGVIVITTKKGRYNQKTSVDFNTSMSIGTRPDLKSQRQIGINDYINLEQSLFNQGNYEDYFTNPDNHNHETLSPVVNLLQKVKNGEMTQEAANKIIDAYRGQDVRNDFAKYIYQPSTNQQYSFNIKGGSDKSKYFVSAGYNNDHYSDNSVAERYTLNASTSFSLLKNLEITLPIYYSQGKERSNPYILNYNFVYPYAKLADANGNPLDINYLQGYNEGFNQQAISQGLYSYSYNPLAEFQMGNNYTADRKEVRISPMLKYSFGNGFQADIQYQYNTQILKNTSDQSDALFGVRKLINSYTQINYDGSLSYPVNKGHILELENKGLTGEYFRTQLNYNKDLGHDHRLDAVLGYEFSENKTDSNRNGWYGYNPETGQVQTMVDYVTYFQSYDSPYSNTIMPLQSGITGNYNVLVSKYGNASYTYKGRYMLSGSGRMDQTNIVGANTNNRQKVLWSVGTGWNIDKEHFYNLTWLPSMKLRGTYGFQGNIPTTGAYVGGVTSLTPLATISYSNYANPVGLNYATLNNVANPDLTWEKIGQFNIGLDFATKGNVLSGTIEYYSKKGDGLIGSYPVDPSSGVSRNVGNIANISGSGIDVNITSRNINGSFKWDTRYIFNYNTDKVTKYLVPPSLTDILSQTTSSSPYDVTPIEGNAIYGVYSLKSAGLDPLTGDPRGYDANGNISKNYRDLLSNTPLENLVYHGSANPVYFGSFLNNFYYKGFGLSVNMSYQAGFYFHQQSVNYSLLYGSNMLGNLSSGADYADRWQKPGDEATTYVPSAPTLLKNSSLRSAFYQALDDLVVKGDNIRLQDIVFTYDINPNLIQKWQMSAVQFYFNATLNAIVWRANTLGIDPQYPGMNPTKVFSWGLRASF
jgi:TonB-linked SusC/RagA family outer membrane protein